MKLLTTLLLVLGTLSAYGQTYTTWLTGSDLDATPDPEFGVLLAGGGGDNDDAMRWLLQRAAGGDVVVLRTSGADGYNDYLFSELNVTVNSVRTVRFEQTAAAVDTVVIDWIRNAEVVFLAGGDQSTYVDFWRDTPVEEALNDLLTEKQGAVGGTSAGMAILGQLYFSATGGTVFSGESLNDPFHPALTAGLVDTANFLQPPFLANTLTDTHWADRDREGRTVAFLARLSAARQTRTYAITCNEYTAVAFDALGTARVFGEAPQYPDYAHFLAVNCQDDFLPETLAAQTPLHWQRGGAAVKVYRVPGTPEGTHTFDLTDWTTGSGGTWQNWSVEDGMLTVATPATSDCAEVLTATERPRAEPTVSLYPQPATDWVYLKNRPTPVAWELRDGTGRTLRTGVGTEIGVHDLPAGRYVLRTEGQTLPLVVVRRD